MLDQCALNPDGSLKDAKDIQWFHDKDDAQPLTSTASSTQPGQPLSRGLRNKAINQFLDADTSAPRQYMGNWPERHRDSLGRSGGPVEIKEIGCQPP